MKPEVFVFNETQSESQWPLTEKASITGSIMEKKEKREGKGRGGKGRGGKGRGGKGTEGDGRRKKGRKEEKRKKKQNKEKKGQHLELDHGTYIGKIFLMVPKAIS
jgi:hypothetical protein